MANVNVKYAHKKKGLNFMNCLIHVHGYLKYMNLAEIKELKLGQ